MPFVAPGLLGLDGVVAVISSFGLGPHVAYAIAYYTSELPNDAPRPNEWGAASYRLLQGGWGADDVFETDYDYELGPWIDGAKLQWIAPGDPSRRCAPDGTAARIWICPADDRSPAR